jgi:hypothetical protein
MRFVLALSLGCSVSLSLAALAGCSNSTAPTASPFAGTWSCTKTDALTFTIPANSLPQSNTTSTTIDIFASATGALTSSTLGDGGTTCPITFSSSGSTATLSANQTCTSSGLSLAYSSGTATVSGSALDASLSYSFTGTLSVPGDGGTTTSEAIAGTGTSTYACKTID